MTHINPPASALPSTPGIQPSPRPPLHPRLQGIKPSRVYLPHDQRFIGGDVLGFLCQHFAHISKEQWQKRLDQGLVTTDSGAVVAANSPYPVGQTLLYYRFVDAEPVIPFEPTILQLDNELLVVDKPHFLPVIPTGRFVTQTVLAKLRCHPALQSLDVMAISPIHRLDKDTAGVMLLSVNPATRSHYQRLFEHKQVQKTYEAIAPTRTDLGYPYRIASRLVRGSAFFLTHTVEGEPNAQTTIERLEPLEHLGHPSHDDYNYNNYSRYRLTPLTGKKHQLRVHMASLGMPLMHDRLYPVVQPQGTEDFTKPLQLLAKSIEFIDPISQRRRYIESQLTLCPTL